MKKYCSLGSHSLENVDPFSIKTWQKIREPHDLAQTSTNSSSNKSHGSKRSESLTRRYTQKAQSKASSTATSILTRRNQNKMVRQQRTPAEIRVDDENRETSIFDREIAEMNFTEVRSPRSSISCTNVIMFDESASGSVESKPSKGRIIPIPTSPQGSFTYLQTDILLDVKKPRSGIFINEKKITTGTSPILLDPRKVQSQIDVKRKTRFLVQDGFATQYELESRRKDQSSKQTQVHYDRKCVISGKTHIGKFIVDKETEACTKKRALFVASLGIVYSRLISAPLWTSDTVDNVIVDGSDRFKHWMKTDNDATSLSFPSVLKVDPYRIVLTVVPLFLTGEFTTAVSSFCCCDLTKCLKEVFMNNGVKSAVLEISNKIAVSIWLKGGSYFLFDVNERDEKGSVFKLNADNETPQSGAACLCMSNKLDPICEMIYENTKLFLEPDETITTYNLHLVKIDHVDKLDSNKYISPPIGTQQMAAPVISKTSKFQMVNSVAISRVPHTELSDLSIVGPKKTRKRAAPGFDSTVSKDINETSANSSAIKTLEQICNDVLDPLADDHTKVEKCPDGHEKVSPVKHARKVLVKSDLGFLQKVRRDIGHNIIGVSPKQKPILTLSKEQLIPSNFKCMPDGTEIIYGGTNILRLVDFNKYTAFMAPIVAIVMAQIYCIATWDASIVDRVLAMTQTLIDQRKVIGAPCRKSLSFQMPSKRCNVQVTSFSDCTFATIGTMLQNELNNDPNYMILTSTTCSAALFRRKNFWYLYDTLPCSMVGMRSSHLKTDVATLQRFSNITALSQRMFSNGFFNVDDQLMSVAKVVVKDVKSEKFVPRSDFAENEIIAEVEASKKRRLVQNSKKLLLLNKKIKQETCRINKFNKKAGKDSVEISDDHIVQNRSKSNQSLHKKSSSSAKISNSRSIDSIANASLSAGESFESASDVQNDPYGERLAKVIGYRHVSPDGFKKIQGTTNLPNRYYFRSARIRSCHFVSMYANMLAIHQTLDTWNYRQIDQCIEEGLRIYSAVTCVSTLSKRSIDSITIYGNQYNVMIEDITTEPNECLPKTLMGYFKKNRYIMLQFLNVTFAVIVDNDGFNLFDPYATLELRDTYRPVMLPRAKKSNTLDKNTASWIWLPTMRLLVKYIGQRIRGGDEHLRVCITNVLSFRKSQKAPACGHHLFLQPKPSQEHWRKIALKNVPNEEVSWLGREGSGTIPWSRRMDTNLSKQRRGSPGATWKSYEIELPDDLYSIWANIHPAATAFAKAYRGRQCMAVCMCVGAMSQVYPIEDWNEQLMDFVVVHGDKLFAQRMDKIKETDYEVKLDDFGGKFEVPQFMIAATVTVMAVGRLYCRESNDFNLSKALSYFFSDKHRRFGILQCNQKFLAFGRSADGRFFMYDCQSMGPPLFWQHQGCAYMLLCTTLKRLLQCIVVTLAIPRYGVEFAVHQVSYNISDCKEVKSTPSKSSLKKA